MNIQEVAPPGYGHTKGDKEKGVKKGGTAAAFDRARKEGRFKGSKSDMFAIMWSQKNKGDKPHYKPGTDKKYKKYQEESAVLDANTKISKDEKKKKKEAELRRLLQHAIAVKKGQAESFEIDKEAHKKVQKKAKIRNLAKGNMNPNEKEAAEKKAGGPKLYGEGAAWTKKSGKNPEGGLNEKGRKSYERDNPGSDLKAPSKKVGNPRRASFCARMKGMKSKLTSAKTARDPDSRINKSLRKWNCGYEPQGNLIDEEGYDRMRDDRLVKYGTGHDGSDRKGSTRYHSRPDTPEQKKRKQAASDQAYKSVVASLKKKYGDGVMTSSRKIRKGKEVK